MPIRWSLALDYLLTSLAPIFKKFDAFKLGIVDTIVTAFPNTSLNNITFEGGRVHVDTSCTNI